jgi:hypothetical protein
VVGHDHERPRPEARVQPARRVRQHDDPGPQGLEQQDRLDDEARVVALVQVESALEHDHDPTPEAAQQQAPGVPRCRRRRPAGKLRERDGDGLFEVVREATEP